MSLSPIPQKFRGGIIPFVLILAWVQPGRVPPRAPEDPAPTNTETITLSPFQVSSEGDTGYGVDQTVSATRTATKLADLPISITILTNQFLDDLATTDIQTALLYANVTTPNTDAFTSTVSSTYIVRGFNAATMHDGFLGAGGSTPVARIAIDRVEVVKGPESLLYGEMAPGGLVNIVSKRPSSTPSTTLSAFGGSYDLYGGTLDTTGPITHDGRFTYRLMGSYTDGNAIEVGQSQKRQEWVAMLGGQVSANTDFNLEYDFAHHHAAAPGGEAYFVQLGNDPAGRGAQVQYLVPGTASAPDPSYNYRGPGTYGDGIERYLSAVIHQRWGENWNTRLAYASIWDTTGSITNKTGAPVLTVNGNIAYTSKAGTSTTQSIQYDVTNTWKIFGAELKFLAGAAADIGVTSSIAGNSTFSYTKWTLLSPSTWPVPWPPLSPALSTYTALSSDSGGVSHDGAVYTSDTVSMFQNRLHLLGGAREQRIVSTATNLVPPVSSQGYAENDATYQLGALFQATKTVGVYFDWSESFQPQNAVLRNPKPINPATGLPFLNATNGAYPAKPILGQGHDLGFKATLVEGKLYLNLAYYDVRESNQVQTRVNTDPSSGNTVDTYDVQSGAEWSQGLELGLVGNPFKGVDVMVNYNQPFSGILLSDATTPCLCPARSCKRCNPKEQLSFFVKYTAQTGWANGGFFGLGGRYWGDFQSFQPTQTPTGDPSALFHHGRRPRLSLEDGEGPGTRCS